MTQERSKVMSNKATEHSSTEVLDTMSEFLVGGGVLTMALFPLAIPIIALLIVAALPLLAVGAALAIVGAILIAPVVLIRSLLRRLGTIRRDRRDTRLIRGTRPAMGAR
jgi:membrane protein implicated in regulation of membrane protease activity